MPNPNSQILAGEFRRRRIALKLTLAEVSKRIDLDENFLSLLERGERPISDALRHKLEFVLGLAPSPRDSIIANVDGSTSNTETASEPFLGLRPYTAHDAPLFVGREAFVELAANFIEARQNCLLTGPSGAGKTSVINAGIIPAIRKISKGIQVIETRPGADPFGFLSAAIWRHVQLHAERSKDDPSWLQPDMVRQRLGPANFFVGLNAALGSGGVAIIIDQFEELFRLCAPEDIRRFRDLLESACAGFAGSRDFRLVASLRSEFLPHIAADAGFSRLFQSNLLFVPALDNQEIRRIVRKPIEISHGKIAESVVDKLARSMVGNSTALPLLSVCLAQLWERKKGLEIDEDDLRDVGGLDGAIRLLAEQLFEQITNIERGRLRQLLVEMVAFPPFGSQEPITRKRLYFSSVNGSDRALLDRLVSARLLVSDCDPEGREYLEFAHESLMSAWPRLATWIAEDRETIAHLQEIRDSAQRWVGSERSPILLWGTARLQDYTANWAAKLGGRLFGVEAEFIRSSLEMSKIERASEVASKIRLIPELPAQKWTALISQLLLEDKSVLSVALDAVSESVLHTSIRGAVLSVLAGYSPRSILWVAADKSALDDCAQASLILREHKSLLQPGDQDKNSSPAATPLALFKRLHISNRELADEIVRSVRASIDTTTVLDMLVGLSEPPTGSDIDIAFTHYPDLLDEILSRIAGASATSQFAKCYSLLRQAIQRFPDCSGHILSQLPSSMFEEFFSIALASTSENSLVAQLKATLSDGVTVQSCKRPNNTLSVAALFRLGQSDALLGYLNAASNRERLPELAVDSPSLGVSASEVSTLLHSIILPPASKSAPLVVSTLIQMLIGPETRQKRSDSLQNLILDAARCVNCAVVCASAEWALRQLGYGSDEIFSNLPSAGEDYFVVDFDNGGWIKFVRCPATIFSMGRISTDESIAYLDSASTRTVSITSEYWLSDRLVSQAIYELGRQALSLPMLPNISHVSNMPDAPVVAITWSEAWQVCDWIGELARNKRPDFGRIANGVLPTEAQWEAACRAGAQTRYFFGADPRLLTDFAWFSDNSDNIVHPGGSKRPNNLGLFDMHGNCWEWCYDWFADYSKNDGDVDPTGPSFGETKILRGGCWNLAKEWCRCFSRNSHPPQNRNYYTGFRVLLASRGGLSADDNKKLV